MIAFSFCPYCGFHLGSNTTAASEQNNEKKTELIRSYFSNTTITCIAILNAYDKQFEKYIASKLAVSKYEKNYSIMKQSNNRKTLLQQTEAFVTQLDAIITYLNDDIAQDIIAEIHEMIELNNELYDFLGLQWRPFNKDILSEITDKIKVRYTKQQLQNLYELVLASYQKYKKCVEDNNMFAAFSSESDYGNLPTWSTKFWLSLPSDKIDADMENEKNQELEDYNKAYIETINYMKEHNAQAYLGMLDEDFVPHVDAFWHGLQMLCSFIDHRIAVEDYIKQFYISNKEQEKVLQFSSLQNFAVTEQRLNDIIKLKEHFEEKFESLKTKTQKI